MKLIFPVAVYLDLDFEVDDDFMIYYVNFCRNSKKSFERGIKNEQLKESPSEHRISFYKNRITKYSEALKYSKEDIEKILKDEIDVFEDYSTILEIIRSYLTNNYKILQNCDVEWEPDYMIEEGED